MFGLLNYLLCFKVFILLGLFHLLYVPFFLLQENCSFPKFSVFYHHLHRLIVVPWAVYICFRSQEINGKGFIAFIEDNTFFWQEDIFSITFSWRSALIIWHFLWLKNARTGYHELNLIFWQKSQWKNTTRPELITWYHVFTSCYTVGLLPNTVWSSKTLTLGFCFLYFRWIPLHGEYTTTISVVLFFSIYIYYTYI